MTYMRTALAAALVTLGSSACGSQALTGTDAGPTVGDGPGACTMQTPSPPPADPDPGRAATNAAAFMYLDQIVGQYVRGDTPVYGGSAAAHANVDAVGNIANETLQTSSARAALSVDPQVAGLTVFSASERERISFQQQQAFPATTFVSAIVPNGRFGGGPLFPVNASNSATCTACTPDLTSAPAALFWQGVEAVAAAGSDAAPLDVTSSVDLQRISPCALTWDDIVALSADYTDDLPSQPPVDGVVVHTLSGSVVIKPASPRMCDGIQVSYTIDAYINSSNLADYGVRNLTSQTSAIFGGA